MTVCVKCRAYRGWESLDLNCTETKSLVPGTSASNKLSRFFDKVCIFKVLIHIF